MRNRLAASFALIVIAAALAAVLAPVVHGQGAGAGSLEVKFFFDTPTTVEPTYHTAIWIEDKAGKLVKTLFVSTELASKEFKMGNACPDWVKVASWEGVPKNEVEAVTAPTPSVGVAELSFDLAKLKIARGTYGFRFQVHVSEEYNLLYLGELTVGGPSAVLTIETKQGPGKLDTTDQFVRDVEVRYVAGK
jgi:hypothetical protein